MRVAFLHSDKPRERILANAVLKGARAHGHDTAAINLAAAPAPGEFDIVCMVGVKSRELFRAHHRAGAHIVYLDKGYARAKSVGPVRGWEYWRMSLDAHHPTSRLNRELPNDRWTQLHIEMLPWRSEGQHILIAGSSAKYHDFYGLKDPTTYAKGIVRELRAMSERPIVYRPKPSWRDAVPLLKTRYSGADESIVEALTGAWAVVTHGSNACFEAVVSGIPCVVLGEAVAKPLSSTSLSEVLEPRLASDVDRQRWVNALSYWQWTMKEYASGEAWEFLESELHA